MQADGWLFDLFPQRGEIVLWFILESGERLRLVDPFAPSFFIDAEEAAYAPAEAALLRFIGGMAGLETAGKTERTDFWTGRPRSVLQVRTTDLNQSGRNLKALDRRFPQLRYYNCDILPEVEYCYATGLFPATRCRIEYDGGRLVRCAPLEQQFDTEYPLPPLQAVLLTCEGARLQPRPGLASLTLKSDGRSWTWDGDEPAEMLRSLRETIRRCDPDLIWTRGGDALLMPVLFALAEQLKVDPGLDREPAVQRQLVFSGRTYFSYGQTLYHAPDYPLFGRWHLDQNNSFWCSEAGIDGLIEVARMAKLPVQRAARRSIGTGISSIQLDLAYREGILIPWKKSRPEAWKKATTLLKSDRGGLVYQPLVGVYENVVELDFVSMYPGIMVRRNVSPETIDCACCPPSADVPELGYTICKRREGLVSRAIAPIIAKRRLYKKLMRQKGAAKEAIAAWDGRQGALKWLLVCCFGYLGYRNARFGRIEAHESTCAFSRDILMRAKEMSEAEGFSVLHAIVDCLWLHRPSAATDEEFLALCGEIERETQIPLALEGRYRWIAFLPSRQNPEMPVPNRYFGCFTDGKLKFRGIEARRGDQAPFIKSFQLELLQRLSSARTLAECRAMKEELAGFLREAIERLRRYDVSLEELVLRRKTSLAAEEYRGNSMTAVAARQAKRAGIDLHAGEALHFVVTGQGDKDVDARLRLAALWNPEDSYDADYYAEQLRRAAATVLEPLMGESLRKILGEDKECCWAEERRPALEQLELFAGAGR